MSLRPAVPGLDDLGERGHHVFRVVELVVDLLRLDQGHHPRHQLVPVNRLGEEVVGAQLQGANAVLDGVE